MFYYSCPYKVISHLTFPNIFYFLLQIKPTVSCPIHHGHWEQIIPFILAKLFYALEHCYYAHFSILFVRQDKSSYFILSSQVMFSRPLIIFITLIWITSNIFPSFLKCTAQNWTPAEALTVLSGAEGLFHMSCLVYTSHCDVSLSTTSEHFWLVFNFWFTQGHRWAYKKWLPSWFFGVGFLPHPVSVWLIFFLYLLLLNFIQSFFQTISSAS